MYYVVKIGDMYVGAHGTEVSQRNAMVFWDKPRIVKVTTAADRTAASMRGLASDIEGDNGGGGQ